MHTCAEAYRAGSLSAISDRHMRCIGRGTYESIHTFHAAAENVDKFEDRQESGTSDGAS